MKLVGCKYTHGCIPDLELADLPKDGRAMGFRMRLHPKVLSVGVTDFDRKVAL